MQKFNKKFSSLQALSSLDLLTNGDIKLWACSPLGVAVISSLTRGSGCFESGETVRQRKVANRGWKPGKVASDSAVMTEAEQREQSARVARYNRARLQTWAGRNEGRLGDCSGDIATVTTPLPLHGEKGGNCPAFVERPADGIEGCNVFFRSQVASGGADNPLFESKRAMERFRPDAELSADWFAAFVHQIAVAGAGKAIRSVSGGKARAKAVATQGTALYRDKAGALVEREVVTSEVSWYGGGRNVSQTSKDEALLAAVSRVVQGIRKLCGIDQTRLCKLVSDSELQGLVARRLLPPHGSMWCKGTMGGARYRWLRREAFRGAFNSLCDFRGVTGDNNGKAAWLASGRLLPDELIGKGNGFAACWQDYDIQGYSSGEAEPQGFIGSDERASGFDILPADGRQAQFSQARQIAWQRLGCVLPREWKPLAGVFYNEGMKQRTAVKRWLVAVGVLSGLAPVDAAKRAGFSANWVERGEWAKVRQAITTA